MQIGSYKTIATLGAGGMGIVFRAVDSSGSPVAIKMIGSKAAIDATIHANHAVDKPLALDMKRRMMLVREASTAMGLDHPNIVRVFNYGQHEGLLYIVMEYLQGRSLDKVIPIHAAVPLKIKLSLIRQICEALEYAHRQGVLHRDVKPANAMVLQDAKLKVLDFGLAARMREPLPGEISFVGTPQYMAPELVAGSGSHGFDSRSDIWATGVTLYQFLTGRLPFAAPSIGETLSNISRAQFPRLDESYPHKVVLERILNRALAKNPRNRYSSAGDFALDLKQLEERASERTSLPAGGVTVGYEEPESESTVTRGAFSAGPEASKADKAILMVSGEIRARGSGHMLRFARYNAKALPLIFLGLLYADWFAMYAIATGREGASIVSDFSWFCSYCYFYFFGNSSRHSVLGSQFSDLGTFLLTVAYGFGILMPPLLAVSVWLGFLAFYERVSGIPQCPTCKGLMEHRSQVTSFAHSSKSRVHAASDCLAALKEGLWEDAAKLLSIHGELNTPAVEEDASHRLTSDPFIRYRLDFFTCAQCGDDCAILTTEDQIDRVWNARPEYEGAFRRQNGVSAKPSLSTRVSDSVRWIRRTAQFGAGRISRVSAAFLLISTALVVFYYDPQIPMILGGPADIAAIAIQTNPAGQPIKVDGDRITTPTVYSWNYDSTHWITGLEDRVLNGSLWRFEGVTPDIDVTYDDRLPGAIKEPNRKLRIAPFIDGWGRPTSKPVVPSYTIEFTQVALPSPSTTNLLAPQDAYGYLAGSPIWPIPKANGKVAGGVTRASFLVTSEPSGLGVTVDRLTVATPRSYDWSIGSNHSLTVPVGMMVRVRTTYQIEDSNGIYFANGKWFTDPGDYMLIVTLPPVHSRVISLTYTAKFERMTAQQ